MNSPGQRPTACQSLSNQSSRLMAAPFLKTEGLLARVPGREPGCAKLRRPLFLIPKNGREIDVDLVSLLGSQNDPNMLPKSIEPRSKNGSRKKTPNIRTQVGILSAAATLRISNIELSLKRNNDFHKITLRFPKRAPSPKDHQTELPNASKLTPKSMPKRTNNTYETT